MLGCLQRPKPFIITFYTTNKVGNISALVENSHYSLMFLFLYNNLILIFYNNFIILCLRSFIKKISNVSFFNIIFYNNFIIFCLRAFLFKKIQFIILNNTAEVLN